MLALFTECVLVHLETKLNMAFNNFAFCPKNHLTIQKCFVFHSESFSLKKQTKEQMLYMISFCKMYCVERWLYIVGTHVTKPIHFNKCTSHMKVVIPK